MKEEFIDIKDISALKRSFPERKNSFNIVLVIIALALLAAAVYYFLIRSDDDKKLMITVTEFDGTVSVKYAGKKDIVPADEGIKLQKGDSLITGDDGYAVLEYFDGSITRMAPDTEIIFSRLYFSGDEKAVSVVDLISGKIWNNIYGSAEIQSAFIFNTPSAVAEVKGTQFLIQTKDNDETLVSVFEGDLEVFSASDKDKKPLNITSQKQSLFLPESTVLPGLVALNIMDLGDFEKTCLFEDNLLLFVDISDDINAVLFDKAESDIKETLAEIDIIDNEISYLGKIYSDASDSGKINSLEKLIELLKEEAERNIIIFGLLEEEYEFLLKQKDAFEELTGYIEKELSGVDDKDEDGKRVKIREDASAIRNDENATARKSREKRIIDEVKLVKELREEIKAFFEAVGIAGDMNRLRETLKYALGPYIYPGHILSYVDREISRVTEQTVPSAPLYVPVREITPADPPAPEEPEEIPEEYTVKVEVNPSSGGIVNGAGVYVSGKTVKLGATAAEGYKFINWSIGGEVVGYKSEFVFNVYRSTTITANFARKTYTVLFLDHDNTKIKEAVVKHGNDATAPADPERTGYTFKGWDKDFSGVTSEIAVTALYEINEYILTYIPEYNGSIEGEVIQAVTHGSDGTEVIAVPDEDYHFVIWSDGLDTPSRTDLNVTEDISVRALFTRNGKLLTIASDEGGTVVLPGEGFFIYEFEDLINLAAEADEGYEFLTWTVSGEHENSFGGITTAETDFTMPDEDVVITALFIETEATEDSENELEEQPEVDVEIMEMDELITVPEKPLEDSTLVDINAEADIDNEIILDSESSEPEGPEFDEPYLTDVTEEADSLATLSPEDSEGEDNKDEDNEDSNIIIIDEGNDSEDIVDEVNDDLTLGEEAQTETELNNTHDTAEIPADDDTEHLADSEEVTECCDCETALN